MRGSRRSRRLFLAIGAPAIAALALPVPALAKRAEVTGTITSIELGAARLDKDNGTSVKVRLPDGVDAQLHVGDMITASGDVDRGGAIDTQTWTLVRSAASTPAPLAGVAASPTPTLPAATTPAPNASTVPSATVTSTEQPD